MAKPKKQDLLKILVDFVKKSDIPEKDDILDLLSSEIINLENRAFRAREKGAERRQNDVLREMIYQLLSEDRWTCGDELLEALQPQAEDLTKQKIISRCTALVKDGYAEKQSILYNDKKVMGYKKISIEE